jgi:hypothetical protein
LLHLLTAAYGTCETSADVRYTAAFGGQSRRQPGELPGSGWQLLAAQGSRGVRGERGEMGPAAAPLRWISSGLNFRDGVALEARLSDGSVSRLPLFKTITVDTADFTLKFVGADDSVLRVNLAPLFKEFQKQTGR